MASVGRRSEEGGESLNNRDSSSHQYNYQRRRQQQQEQYQSQPHLYNQSFSPRGSYPHEQLQHGQIQQMQSQHPPGNAINTNGNYNNSKSAPVPPRVRLRKWSDMTRTIWHYERIEQIGEGTYGQVYRARCKDTNEIVAMKKIRVHYGGHSGMPPTVIREIKILKRLVHPNLVRMIEVVSSKGVEHLDADDYHKGSDRSRKKHKHKSGSSRGDAEKNGKDNKNSTKNDTSNNTNSKQIDISDAREGYKGNLFLVLEYVPHDLTGLLDVAYKFSEVEIKCVFRQLLEALRYMHDQKYVHRDIKSSNILIDRHFRLKLADFGLARSIEPPLLDNLHDRGNSQEFTNKVITLWYRPPELLLGATRYGFAVDIWSAGCILAELVLGRPLFTGKTEMDQLQLIFDMVGTPTSKSWPGVRELKLLRTGDVTIDGDSSRKRPKLRERYQTKMNNIAPGAINLVEKLLELDPSKRLTASRALNHRYFLQEPRAPDRAEELGEMKLAEGGSFHEFQTKKKRKEAKAQAEKIKQAALDGGHTAKQAQEEFDACYRGIMEKIAQEGLASATVVRSENKTSDLDNGKDHQKGVEGDSRRVRDELNTGAKEPDYDGNEDRLRSKDRSSRSDRSQEQRAGSSRSIREKDYRDLSSRGRERHRGEVGTSGNRQDKGRERSREKSDKEKNRDGSGTFAGTADGSHRDRDHGRERSRSSRRTSESDDRRKKRHREEDTERSSRSTRDKDKERHRQQRKAPKMGSDGDAIESKNQNEYHQSTEMTGASQVSRGEEASRRGATTDESLNTKSMPKEDSTVADSADKTKETVAEKSQSLPNNVKNDDSIDTPGVVDKPNETEESKPDQEKQSGSDHHSRSSRGDKKRSDRSRDRSRDDEARKDRRDRDRDHRQRRRSSKERDGRARDDERGSSTRRDSKKRKGRTRSRSPEREKSPVRNRDDRHHRQRREREHSRHERDRFHHNEDMRDLERRPRNDRHHHHDDWGPRGPPPAMQRRGGDFGGNSDFGGPPQHHRNDYHPRGGDPYGSVDRGPRGDGRGGGDFRGPPGRHPGPRHGGRPMDYYPPGGDHPPPGYRDRDHDRGSRRDRDRR